MLLDYTYKSRLPIGKKCDGYIQMYIMSMSFIQYKIIYHKLNGSR